MNEVNEASPAEGGVDRVVMRHSDIFNEYLERGFDDVMSFPDYLEARMLVVNVTDA